LSGLGGGFVLLLFFYGIKTSIQLKKRKLVAPAGWLALAFNFLHQLRATSLHYRHQSSLIVLICKLDSKFAILFWRASIFVLTQHYG
jgi:hypothetical protein